jgi:ABC-type transport system involved in multi-copper enzyme maturation permease subunit
MSKKKTIKIKPEFKFDPFMWFMFGILFTLNKGEMKYMFEAHPETVTTLLVVLCAWVVVKIIGSVICFVKTWRKVDDIEDK